MGMPDYRFVLLYRKKDGATLIYMECRDDNHACMVGRRLTFPPHGHAQVWAGSRFVRTVKAAMEVMQDAEPLPAVANAVAYFFPPTRVGRGCMVGTAAAKRRGFGPYALSSRNCRHEHTSDRINWVLLIVVGLAALVARLVTGGP